MECPYCTGESNVVDSRSIDRGVRRRRVCGTCKRRFTTYERVAPPSIKVAKRNGKTEPFDPEKIERLLTRVCRDRVAIKAADIRRITASIEADLIDARVKTIESGALVERLLNRLSELDKLSYDRLAANYLDEQGQLRTSSRSEIDDHQLGLFAGDE